MADYGGFNIGSPGWIRTSDLRINGPQAEKCNINNEKELHATPKGMDNPRDTFSEKVTGKEPAESPLDLHPDLAEIASLWPALPDQIRAGLVAMVKAAAGKGN